MGGCLLLALPLAALAACTPPAPGPRLAAGPPEGEATGAGPGRLGATEARAPEESGLFRIVTGPSGEVDSWFQRNPAGGAPADTTWVMAGVHDRPDESAPTRGTIRTAANAGPSFKLALEFHPSDGREPAVWLEQRDGDDWGYGVYTFVRGRAGAWARLPSVPFGEGAWVRVGHDGRGLSGDLESAEGHLVDFGPLAVVDPATGTRESAPEGTYFVVRADSSSVEARPELPSDFPCGQEVPPDPPPAAVPRFQIPTEALFDDGGRPQLSVAYDRGC
jgi:hypothetical protein